MSALILGMEFPKTCAACEWSSYSFPNAWCGRMHKTIDIEIAKNGRPDDCPIIPVPPHGDLIERDKLREKEFIHDGDAYAVVMSRDIRNATTIIPADESNMDSFIRIFEEDDEEDGMDSFIRILKD